MAHIWEERLAPKFRKVVENLQPLLLLDLLVERGLLDLEQYKYLNNPWQHATDEDRSRRLLSEILPKKGPQSFNKFCEVLLEVPDQAFIARDILEYRSPAGQPSDSASSSETEHRMFFSVASLRNPSALCCLDRDQELYALADEVGAFWKDLAVDVGISYVVDAIEREALASSPKEQAFKMLRKLHAKMGHSNFNFEDIRARIKKIKRKQYDAQLKSNIGAFCLVCLK